MGRLGERDPDAVLALVDRVAADDRLDLAGVWTHFATADEPDSDFFDEQLGRFGPLAERVRAEHPACVVHAANSAATLRDPASHFDMVRCGIAIYGLDPFQADPFARGLEPALELRSYVADIKRFEPGRAPATAGAGARPPTPGSGCCRSATGTASAAALTNNAEALVGGTRYPLVGTVSMDNVTIDLGPETRASSPARRRC